MLILPRNVALYSEFFLKKTRCIRNVLVSPKKKRLEKIRKRMNKIPKELVLNEKIGKIEKGPNIVPYSRRRVQFRIYFEFQGQKLNISIH